LVVLLAGGTGGAKLARGLLDAVGPGDLAVIANTADDAEVYGVHVSPDPDLVTYWLADAIDERGYGIAGDTWEVMGAFEAAGRPAWFRLGDRDLAMCLIRTELLAAGERLTAAHAEVVRAMGVDARVLPMSDEPVRTHVVSGGRPRPFQEFMIVERAEAPIEAVELRGVEAARPSPDVLEAIAAADAIVIGPSNPVISIGPILAVPGMRDALDAAAAPVVAVSPFVGGRVVKGPTEPFMRHAGLPLGAAGALAAYEGLLDGLVCDERLGDPPVPLLVTDTLMDDADSRRRVAAETLEFAAGLARDRATPPADR
jgi:LPPG:FO 2-phospho-L-lactate transferase